MLTSAPNESVALALVIADGNNSLFAITKVFNSVGSLVATITLTNTSDGLYVGSFTPTTIGLYTLIYSSYLDVGHTILSRYESQAETLDVSSDRANILRILGLLQDNAVFDQQTYTPSGQLTSGRVRAYDSKTNADAAGVTGLLFTYLISASYNGSNLISYKLTRDV